MTVSWTLRVAYSWYLSSPFMLTRGRGGDPVLQTLRIRTWQGLSLTILYDILENMGVQPVATGEFGAHMAVKIYNDGPVTIWLDSEDWTGQ